MLIFDQLRKDEPHLRAVALFILGGLGILLAGLWWVQVVSARDFQANLETQSFRTVRIPAVRGKILDCTGTNVLAENRPTYNISLYLEELRRPFDAAYSQEAARARSELKRQLGEEEKRLKRKLTRKERKAFLLTTSMKDQLRQQARYEVASNVVSQPRPAPAGAALSESNQLRAPLQNTARPALPGYCRILRRPTLLVLRSS